MNTKQNPSPAETVDMDTIRGAYRNLQPEGHWFDPSSMRFFRTRLPKTGVLCYGHTCFFVTSEQYISHRGEASPRLFTVRKMDWRTGNICTFGKFYEMTKREAYSALADAVAQAQPLA